MLVKTQDLPIYLVFVPFQSVIDSGAHAAGHDAVGCVSPVMLVGVRRWPMVQVMDLR